MPVFLQAIFLQSRKKIGIFRHIWPVRLVVRTPGFRPDNRGSIPLRATFLPSFPIRDVAQSGSVLAWGASGRRFKSCHPDIAIEALSTSHLSSLGA